MNKQIVILKFFHISYNKNMPCSVVFTNKYTVTKLFTKQANQIIEPHLQFTQNYFQENVNYKFKAKLRNVCEIFRPKLSYLLLQIAYNHQHAQYSYEHKYLLHLICKGLILHVPSIYRH